MTVSELGRRMSSAEFTEWQAFALVEPFGQAVDDFRAGIGAAMHVNLKRQEGAPAVSPLAFFSWHASELDAAETVPTPEQESAAIIQLFDKATRRNG